MADAKIGCKMSVGDATAYCYRYRTRAENVAACIRGLRAMYAAEEDDESEPDWSVGDISWFSAQGSEGTGNG